MAQVHPRSNDIDMLLSSGQCSCYNGKCKSEKRLRVGLKYADEEWRFKCNSSWRFEVSHICKDPFTTNYVSIIQLQKSKLGLTIDGVGGPRLSRVPKF